jgi:flagellar biosynthesis/type III secretory pathway chaperone
MSDDTHEDTLQSLEQLLNAERAALLAGDLEGLSEMISTKEALIGQLNDKGPGDIAAWQALDQQLKRNQLLLDGALDGIRAVAGRLAKLREMKGPLETYGADGLRHQIETDAQSTVEKRA